MAGTGRNLCVLTANRLYMAIRPGIFISTPDTFPDTFMNKYIASSAPFPEKSALAPLMCGTRAENGDFAYKQELPVNCR
jgi:hypothetical protein